MELNISEESVNEFYKKLTAVEESEVPSASELESLFKEAKDVLCLYESKKKDPEAIETACGIYRRLCAVAERNLTELKIFRVYSRFLFSKDMNREALQYAQKLEALYDSRECGETDFDRERLYRLISRILRKQKPKDFDIRINYCLKEANAIRRQIDKAEEEETEISCKKTLISTYEETADLFFDSEKKDEAKDYYLLAFSLMEEIIRKGIKAEFYRLTRDCVNAFDCSLKADEEKNIIKFLKYLVEEAEKQTDLSPYKYFQKLYAAYNAIGNFYYKKGEFEKSLEYALKSLQLFENSSIYEDTSLTLSSGKNDSVSVSRNSKNISELFVKKTAQISLLCHELGDEKEAIKYTMYAIKIAEKRIFNNPANHPGETDSEDIIIQSEIEKYEEECKALLFLYKRMNLYLFNLKKTDEADLWVNKLFNFCEMLAAKIPKRFELEPVKAYFAFASQVDPEMPEQIRGMYKKCIEKIRALKYTKPEEYEPVLAKCCFYIVFLESDDDPEYLKSMSEEALRLAEKYAEDDELCARIVDILS